MTQLLEKVIKKVSELPASQQDKFASFMLAELEVFENQCDEEDPELLAALDEAVAQTDSTSHDGYSREEVRARMSEWTSE